MEQRNGCSDRVQCQLVKVTLVASRTDQDDLLKKLHKSKMKRTVGCAGIEPDDRVPPVALAVRSLRSRTACQAIGDQPSQCLLLYTTRMTPHDLQTFNKLT